MSDGATSGKKEHLPGCEIHLGPVQTDTIPAGRKKKKNDDRKGLGDPRPRELSCRLHESVNTFSPCFGRRGVGH